MKKRFLPLALFISLGMSFTLYAQWEAVTTNLFPTNHRVWDIQMVDENVIWAFSSYDGFPPPASQLPIVQRSTDGGSTWQSFPIPGMGGVGAVDLFALDAMVAYITLGSNGLYRTTNGGGDWEHITVSTSLASLIFVHFYNENEGWVFGRKTNNHPISAITADAGATWTVIDEANAPPYVSNEYYNAGFATNSTYDVAGDNIVLATSRGYYWKSSDRAQSWERVSNPLSDQALWLTCIAIKDEFTMMLVAEGNSSSSLPTLAYTTTDGGNTWTQSSPGITPGAIHYIPGTCGTFLLSGHNSFIPANQHGTAVTYDAGLTWQLIDNTRLISVDFLDAQTGIGALGTITQWGSQGEVYKWVGDLSKTPIFVNKNATGNNDGSSWADAYTDLQDALAAAEEGDEIWVAEGTYLPGTDPAATFLIDKNLKLYGGFAGLECNLSERDFALHPTVLSGDVEGDDVVDDFVTNRGDNVMTVVTMTAAVTNETVVDGFTVWNGHADGATAPLANGGGLQSNGNPIVRNCTFTQNFAVNLGGGMSFRNASEMTSIFENCQFDHNLSGRGGAADIRFSNIQFINCTFSNNQALATVGQTFEENGGGIMTQNANCHFKKCTFSNNSCDNGGGGFFFWVDVNGEGFSLTVDSCHFEGNTAASGGAIFSNTFGKNTTLTLTNSTIVGNESIDEFSYGNVSIYHIQAGAYGTALIENCLFEGNVSNWASGGLDMGSGIGAAPSSYSIQSCTFKNNIANHSNAGGLQLFAEQNTDAQFEVLDCSFEGNEAGGNGGGLLFSTGSNTFSATVSHCEFIGNKSSSGGALGSFPDVVVPATPTTAKLKLENCLFAENISPTATISITDLVNLEFVNCTVAKNSSGGILLQKESSIALQNTLLANPNFAEFEALSTEATITSNGGNLVLDNSMNSLLTPLDKPETEPGFEPGTYEPSATSPLVNAGVNAGVTATTDLAGNERIQQGIVDIGAFESPFLPTSVREIIVGDIGLAPNPATDLLFLELPATAKPTRFDIFDAQGRLVQTGAFSEGKNLQVGQLPGGVFTLKMTDGGRVYVGRFVKQ